jgi:hypothetical protein
MKIWGNNFFSQHIFPGRYTAIVEKKIKSGYDEINSIESYNVPKGKKEEMIGELVKNIEEQQDRKKGLEDKVKAILFSISIAITAITFSLSYEQTTITTVPGIIALTILSLSIFYFVSSAIVAVKTLIPVGFSSIQTDVKFDADEKIIKLNIPKVEGRLHQLLKDKLLNDNVNLRISNATYASLKLLRNGIILFAVYFVIAISQKVFYKNDNPSNGSIVNINLNDTTKLKINVHYKNDKKTVLKIDSSRLLIDKKLEKKKAPIKQISIR